jgi:hypothetical protein
VVLGLLACSAGTLLPAPGARQLERPEVLGVVSPIRLLMALAHLLAVPLAVLSASDGARCGAW